MKILKFGGTSMGSPESISNSVIPIIQSAIATKKPIAVVVSAMTKITNTLLTLHEAALKRKKIDKDLLKEIKSRHEAVIETIVSDELRSDGNKFIDDEISSLQNFLKALSVLGISTVRSVDAVMSLGEKLSAKVLSLKLADSGVPASYCTFEELIPETKVYNDDAYWDDVEVLIRECVGKTPSGSVPIITGYLGKTANGLLQDVGRGYSDYCAALVGAALRAEEIQIWTDVDGVLTTNPQLCPKAQVLEHISFDEMAELSQFGAKVLHPFSVRPAENNNISLRILNTFNPTGQTTLVTSEESQSSRPFKSIAYKKDVCVLRISTPKMLLAYGYIAKVGEVFAKHGTSVDLLSTSEVSVSLTCNTVPDSELLSDLQKLGKIHITSGAGIVSLVGSELNDATAAIARALTVLSRDKVAVSMISFGDLKINFSLVMAEDDVERSVQALHAEFFEGSAS